MSEPNFCTASSLEGLGWNVQREEYESFDPDSPRVWESVIWSQYEFLGTQERKSSYVCNNLQTCGLLYVSSQQQFRGKSWDNRGIWYPLIKERIKVLHFRSIIAVMMIRAVLANYGLDYIFSILLGHKPNGLKVVL